MALGRTVRKLVLWAAVLVVALPAATILLYRIVPPPLTPLMVIRHFQGAGIEKQWVPLTAISPHVPQAVIAAEDNLFCEHFGFDWEALKQAAANYRAGRAAPGASTITMQTAKNLFLWPGRSLLRKGLEAYLTVLIEILWDKRRIIEVYLNIVEWGDGIYGVETAARTYFGRPAADLSRREGAILAATLPSPLRWSPAKPSAYVRERAGVIGRRIGQLGPILDCVAVKSPS